MRRSITMQCTMSVRAAGPAALAFLVAAVAFLLNAGCAQPRPASLDAEWPLLLERQGDRALLRE